MTTAGIALIAITISCIPLYLLGVLSWWFVAGLLVGTLANEIAHFLKELL